MNCIAPINPHSRDCENWAPWPDFKDHSVEFFRVLSAAQEGGSTLYECIMTADRIVAGDDESWHREWQVTAETCERRAATALAAGHHATARSNWVRASNYFRTSEAFLAFGDARRQSTIEQMRSCSRKYLDRLEPPGEVVRISDSDGEIIESYFLRAPTAPSRTPVVLCVGGWDDFKDEHLFKMQRHAFDRGLSLLLIEAPKAIPRDRDRWFGRFHVASLIGACADHLVERGDVDESRMAIYGAGLGAVFATEVVALDQRFSAAVCDGGMLDLRRKALAFQQLLGNETPESVEPYLRGLQGRSLARQIRCPVLLVSANQCDWPEAGDAADETETSTTVARATPGVSAGDVVAPDMESLSPQVSNEYIFDWIAGRLAESGNAMTAQSSAAKRFADL